MRVSSSCISALSHLDQNLGLNIPWFQFQISERERLIDSHSIWSLLGKTIIMVLGHVRERCL